MRGTSLPAALENALRRFLEVDDLLVARTAAAERTEVLRQEASRSRHDAVRELCELAGMGGRDAAARYLSTMNRVVWLKGFSAKTIRVEGSS